MGWLINDVLTTIPGTKTFWHDLLKWIPGLENKTGGYTNYSVLADKIERMAKDKKPDYIIRNATFFRPLNIETKTIAFLQDIYKGQLREGQIEVCKKADVIVFNSVFTYYKYKDDIKGRRQVIPIGIDFDFFKPLNLEKKYDIIYVGDTSIYPKGFDLLTRLIHETDFTFCLVLKDDVEIIDHSRVTIFRKVNHNKLLELYNQSRILVCTSNMETLHLAGMEAAACGLPIIATNVGIYFDREADYWGMVSEEHEFIENINFILDSYDSFNSRDYFLSRKLDKQSCKTKWIELVNSLR